MHAFRVSNPHAAQIRAGRRRAHQRHWQVLAKFGRAWHPEFKSLAPDGTLCKGDTRGLLKRCPITSSGIKLIGKETERGWEQDDDISTLLPLLVRYDKSDVRANDHLREKLQRISIDALQAKTGLSRNTILRARSGEKVRPKSVKLMRDAVAALAIEQLVAKNRT